MKNVLYVSFKEDEEWLKVEIEKRSSLSSVSGWMKQAAAEKIRRENNQEIKILDDFLNNK